MSIRLFRGSPPISVLLLLLQSRYLALILYALSRFYSFNFHLCCPSACHVVKPCRSSHVALAVLSRLHVFIVHLCRPTAFCCRKTLQIPLLLLPIVHPSHPACFLPLSVYFPLCRHLALVLSLLYTCCPTVIVAHDCHIVSQSTWCIYIYISFLISVLSCHAPFVAVTQCALSSNQSCEMPPTCLLCVMDQHL